MVIFHWYGHIMPYDTLRENLSYYIVIEDAFRVEVMSLRFAARFKAHNCPKKTCKLHNYEPRARFLKVLGNI